MYRGIVLVLGKSLNVCVCDPGMSSMCAAPVIFASASPRGLGKWLCVHVSGVSLECGGF